MAGKAINLMRVQLRAHSVTYTEGKCAVRGSVNETLQEYACWALPSQGICQHIKNNEINKSPFFLPTPTNARL